MLAFAMLFGMALKFAGFRPVAMLFWPAVIDGAMAPPLIFLVVRLTSRADIMGPHANSRVVRWLGWASVAVTGAAALGMFASLAAGK